MTRLWLWALAATLLLVALETRAQHAPYYVGIDTTAEFDKCVNDRIGKSICWNMCGSATAYEIEKAVKSCMPRERARAYGSSSPDLDDIERRVQQLESQ